MAQRRPKGFIHAAVAQWELLVFALNESYDILTGRDRSDGPPPPPPHRPGSTRPRID